MLEFTSRQKKELPYLLSAVEQNRKEQSWARYSILKNAAIFMLQFIFRNFRQGFNELNNHPWINPQLKKALSVS